MEVILLEKVGKLGGLGDRITVKGGYARNFLLHKAALFWQMKQISLNSKRVAPSLRLSLIHI